MRPLRKVRVGFLSAKVRSLWPKVLLAVSSLAIALVLGEGVVRIASPPAGWMVHQKLFVEYDPELGWRKIPGFEGRIATTEYDVREAFNSRGLRGPEYSYVKPRGVNRILLLGDSFVEGYTVQFEETVGEQLRKMMDQAKMGKTEVINGGTGGYSTDQELLFLEKEGQAYRPDTVILLFYYNDVYFNNRGFYSGRARKPRYVATPDGTLQLVNVPIPRPTPLAFSLQRWLATNSHLYRLAETRLRAPPVVLPVEYVFMRTDRPEIADAWRMTEVLLTKIKRDVQAIGARFFVFYIPESWALDPSLFQTWISERRLNASEWSANEPETRLVDLCRRNNIDLLDPSASFVAEQNTVNQPLYFKLDGHWTAAGHHKAAELIFRYMHSGESAREGAP